MPSLKPCGLKGHVWTLPYASSQRLVRTSDTAVVAVVMRHGSQWIARYPDGATIHGISERNAKLARDAVTAMLEAQ